MQYINPIGEINISSVQPKEATKEIVQGAHGHIEPTEDQKFKHIILQSFQYMSNNKNFSEEMRKYHWEHWSQKGQLGGQWALT